MALKTFVKVGGVSNLSDARYCAGMGVDIIGFSLDPQDALQLNPEQYIAITEWISGVQYAAEFHSLSAAEIEAQLPSYQTVDMLQVTDYRQLSSLQHLQLPLMLKIDLGQLTDIATLAEVLQDAQPYVQYFLLENESAEEKDIWLDDVLRLAERHAILLGFGIHAGNVLSVVEQSSIKGIALKGSEEIKPGYKSYDELADILEVLEIDDLA